MEDREASSLLERYRRDRRKLLEFLLSSGLAKELRTPSGPTTSLSHIDFDNLSADYVLDRLSSGKFALFRFSFLWKRKRKVSFCLVAKKICAVVDVSEASKKYLNELDYPVTIHSQSGTSYYLVSEPESVGSPPRRAPPPLEEKRTVEKVSSSSSRQMDSLNEENTATAGDDYGRKYKSNTIKHVKVPPLGLPNLRTGLSDDDLQKSAYEILLASVISEAMDLCVRRRLQLPTRRTYGKTDIPQISLGLLNSIFKSDFLHEKSYMQWKSRQVGVLEELLQYSVNLAAPEQLTIKSSLANIRNSERWDMALSPSERVEVLSTIKHVASKLSSLPGRFGIESETCYWTAGYHLNMRLYEKLLFSVFDSLDESQLIEEAEEILKLIKLTWPILGITQKIHDAIFGWVLFQQFVETDEAKLLEYAILELQKVASVEDDDKERIYTDSLACLRQCGGNEVKLSLIQAIFFSISSWCIGKLQDYHLHFSQQPGNFKRVMTLVATVGIPTSSSHGDIKMGLTSFNVSDNNSSKIIKSFVESSIETAYNRISSSVDLESKVERKHPLCLLANELKLIVEREIKVFYPVLRHWCPESGTIIAIRLHHIYGEKLEKFLKEVLCLSEDAQSVLPVARLLDCDLTKLYMLACGENSHDLHHYPIGEVAKRIILDWVIARHSHILEWTGRAFDIEEWEPLSSQQRQAASIVEVFRIIEETVDQLFGLNLPMDITNLQALLSIIFHTLDAYLVKMVNQLVEKNHLYPSAPPLTRYKETSMQIMKKKLLECILLDDNFIQNQIDVLEDGIRKSWALVSQSDKEIWAKKEPQELTCGEEVDELFATTFNIIRDTSSHAISKICDFIGPRVVFWDLRDAFISGLYRGNVEGARLDSVLPHFDTVLDHVCGLIDDCLRDLVILSICKASLEGFAWVLLDGGPSRAFSDSDVTLLEDDLAMLKEFFVADGEGLPYSLVEQEAKFAERILDLYSLETESVIQILMTASEQISLGLESHDHDHMHVLNVHTLMRVLCHKRDAEASRFLKTQYQLPMSSEYEDTPSKDSTYVSPLIPVLLKRSTSFHGNKKSHGSFNSFKKKIQEATLEIRNVGW
ncbi:hypothetical protein L484_010558 [Morus notabilis]|uniref:MHD1 domain-containing protein n=1 Tax=Morus notabilis TaxID=981085 RepID=W9SB27_9ROSA|nr:hypothetical protein L484_010558 [Morus notabilis]